MRQKTRTLWLNTLLRWVMGGVGMNALLLSVAAGAQGSADLSKLATNWQIAFVVLLVICSLLELANSAVSEYIRHNIRQESRKEV